MTRATVVQIVIIMIMAILAMNRRRPTNTPIAAAMNQYVGVRARGRRVSTLDLIVRLDWTLRRVQEDQTNENQCGSSAGVDARQRSGFEGTR